MLQTARRLLGWLAVAMAIILLGVAAGTDAQAATEPSIAILHEGDLYTWDGLGTTPQRRTYDGFNDAMAYHGSLIALRRWSPQYVQYLRAGVSLPVFGAPPADIWLLNLTAGTRTRLTSQTAFGPSIDSALVRSGPAISPNGQYVTWLERAIGAFSGQLMIYDLASRTTEVRDSSVNLGYETDTVGNVRRLPTPQWGRDNIVLLTRDQGPQVRDQYVLTFWSQQAGRAPKRLVVRQCTPDSMAPVPDFVWGRSGIRPVIFVVDAAGAWSRVLVPDWNRNNDPILQPMAAPPVLTRDRGTLLISHINDERVWVHNSSDGTVGRMGSGSVPLHEHTATLLPGGATALVAYRYDGVRRARYIGILRGGVTTDLVLPSPNPARWPYAPDTLSVAASGVEWTDDTGPAPQVRLCPNSPPSRLRALGSTTATTVVGFWPYGFRSGAGGGIRYSSIPENRVVQILGAPRCGADGRTWWPVVYGRLRGWTAEGDDYVYWLEPGRP